MSCSGDIRYFSLAVCEYHDTAGKDGKTPRSRWLEAMRDENGRVTIPRNVHDAKNFVIEVLPEKKSYGQRDTRNLHARLY